MRQARAAGATESSPIQNEHGWRLGRRLWGAIEDERTFTPLGGWQRHSGERYARIRARDTAFDAAVSAGRGLDLDEAVERALAQT